MEKWNGKNVTVVNGSVSKWSLNDSLYQHLDPGELRVLVPAVLGVIGVLGGACNLTAMVILFSNAHRGKLSLINSLVFNLMFADGLVLAFTLPFRAASYAEAGWNLGWVVCKTADWFLHSCMAAKSFTIAAMAKACHRYVANPTKQVSVHLGSILVVIVFIWLSACSVTVPLWLFARLERESHRLACVLIAPPEARGFMSAYVKAYPLGVYCAPLSFSLMYFWKAYGQCQRRSGKTQNLRAQIRSRKLTLMLFSLTVATVLLWLPQWVAWVWERHLAEKEVEGARPRVTSLPPLFSLSAQLLIFSLSLVNPVVVLSLSEEFREGYRGLWRRLTLRKQPPSKAKPGPHQPTGLRSPCPRREPFSQPLAERRLRSNSGQGPSGEAQPGPEQRGGGPEADAASLRDGIVLPDVEQFWQERETGSRREEDDPVPWEHQSAVGERQASTHV